MGNSPIFICYSVPLMKFLTEENGFRYHVVGLNPDSKYRFWVFMRSEKFNSALQQWHDEGGRNRKIKQK